MKKVVCLVMVLMMAFSATALAVTSKTTEDDVVVGGETGFTVTKENTPELVSKVVNNTISALIAQPETGKRMTVNEFFTNATKDNTDTNAKYKFEDVAKEQGLSGDMDMKDIFPADMEGKTAGSVSLETNVTYSGKVVVVMGIVDKEGNVTWLALAGVVKDGKVVFEIDDYVAGLMDAAVGTSVGIVCNK